MILIIYRNVLKFLFLILLQVVILNHIQWSGYINPYVYIVFIMLLPVETPNWIVLLLGLILGLVIDMFSNTSGLHAAATTLMAFARPGILRLISPRDDYEPETALTPQKMGLKWFITYAVFLTLIHHLFYFYVEVFRFSEFFLTFFKAILNSIITLILIVLGTYLFSKGKNRIAV